MLLTPPRAALAVALSGLALLAAHDVPPGDLPSADGSPAARERRAPDVAPPRFGTLFAPSADEPRGEHELVREDRARLSVRLAGRYRFTLESEGVASSFGLYDPAPAVELERTADDEGNRTRSEWVELERGSYVALLELRLAETGRARARLLWERADDELGGFPPEPIPARALEPVATDRVEGTPDDSESVRLLLEVERARCRACHASDQETAARHRDAPDLGGLSARVGADWLRRWLADPNALKPSTAMPRTLHGTEQDEAALEALTHYLLKAASGEPGAHPASEERVLDEGRRLYHRVGCVACHGALESPAVTSGDPYLDDTVPDVAVVAPFGDQRGKWRLAGLAAFLREPHAVRPDGRMPSLSLTDDEADRLANYLGARWGVANEGFQPDPALVERGATEFRARSCASCHVLDDVPQGAPVAAAPGTGVGAFHGPGGRVSYVLGEGAAGGLERTRFGALARGLGPAGPTPEALGVDPVRHATARYACLACHALDGAGGPPDELDAYFVNTDERVDLGDEGRYAPDLDGVGWKLNTPWLREVLVAGGRARPYMDLRMPQYGEEHVGDLAEAFAHREGILPNTDLDAPVPTDDAVVVGRQLMGHEWFNCMSCHVYADYPPSGTPGPAITQFGERLRYEWYQRYLRNPQRFAPGSRMPDFGTGERSSLRTILDGDYDAQIDAMWAYFLLGDEMPAPEGVERRGGLLLTVGDEPLVHRAFLPDVGARGIAVGLPIGAHYAFDAVTSRVVYAWRGDFLDASGSWAGRGGNTVGGLGEVFWRAGEEHVLGVVGADGPLPWRFGGYRLGDDGHPTFLYRARTAGGSEVRVEERFEVSLLPEPRLLRSFSVTGMESDVRLRAALPPGTARTLTGGRVEGPTSRDEPPSRVTLAADSPDAPLTLSFEVTP